MFRLLRILGWTVAVALYALAGWVTIGLCLAICHPVGWVLLPGAFVVVNRTRSRLRRRRGLSVLDQLRQGIDLNLPLPPLLAASARSESGLLADRLIAVETRIEQGESIGDALEVVPELTPRTLSMVRAGETVGRLPQTLARLVEQQRIAFTRESADASFTWGYPTAVATTMFVVVMWVAIFIMPKFEKIFDDFGVPLPAMTLRLMDVAKWIGGRLPGQVIPGAVWVLLIIITVALLPLFRRTPLGRAVIDWVLWHLPVSHGLERDRGMGDVCHLLEEATRAGVPIETSLAEAGGLQINFTLRQKVRKWAAIVASGESLERGAQAAHMPPMLVGILTTGHASTSLPQALGFLGRYYDNRCGRAAAILQGAAIPIIVLVLATLVGSIVVSMFLPLVVLIRSVAATGVVS